MGYPLIILIFVEIDLTMISNEQFKTIIEAYGRLEALSLTLDAKEVEIQNQEEKTLSPRLLE